MVLLDKKQLPTSTFACGPGQALPLLRQIPLYQTQFERSHRAADISTEGLYRAATLELKKLLDIPSDYTLVFFPGGATPAMDAVLWSLTKGTLAGFSFGAFSKRWGEVLAARVPGLKRQICVCQAGEFFPAKEPDYTASLVVLTPNETSTGVQMPDEYLTRAWEKRGPDTLVAWDATSCAGGRVLPEGQFDVFLFSLQKCFGAAGGTACVALSPRALARLEENNRAIPYSLDLKNAVSHASLFQTLNTPNTTNIWLCYQAAKWMNEHGGLKAMDELCRRHAAWLVDWAATTDFITPLITDEKFRSYTTLTLKLTDTHVSAATINQALADTGLPNLQDGLKAHPYAPENSLRISCFPFVDTEGIEQYKKLTAALDEIVRQLRKTQ